MPFRTGHHLEEPRVTSWIWAGQVYPFLGRKPEFPEELRQTTHRAKETKFSSRVQKLALEAESDAADMQVYFELEAARRSLECYEVEEARRWKKRA